MSDGDEGFRYAYARPSSLSTSDGQASLALSTSGGSAAAGPAEHPVFFDGFLTHPEQAAAALRAVAAVARTRFYTPPGMLAAILRAADPVVTSNRDRLRFESFSLCCGVGIRYDVLPGGLDGTVLDSGTTNVDFQAPVRDALASVTEAEPLHLRVGHDVTVTTLDTTVTERKVPLPERWLKGFAESHRASTTVTPRFEVPAAEARRLLAALGSSSSRKPVWVIREGSALRATTRPNAEGVSLSSPHRLQPLAPLLRFAHTFRGYAAPHDEAGAVSVWELEMDGARIVLTHSPDSSRGFSGEGGVLADLAAGTADEARTIEAMLAFEPIIDVDALASDTGLPREHVVRALTWLSAAGRVGYDVAEGAYFHRALPFDVETVESQHPRLRAARELVGNDGIVWLEDRAIVKSGDTEYVVRVVEGGLTCSCPWFAKHRSSRGPCKHALAAAIVRG